MQTGLGASTAQVMRLCSAYLTQAHQPDRGLLFLYLPRRSRERPECNQSKQDVAKEAQQQKLTRRQSAGHSHPQRYGLSTGLDHLQKSDGFPRIEHTSRNRQETHGQPKAIVGDACGTDEHDQKAEPENRIR